MKRVVIIGGGIIGLFSAYYLRKKGIDVTIIDRSDLTDNCSYGNAGLIVPSHVIPMASPGMLKKAFTTVFNSKSPVRVPLPPPIDFLKWAYRFGKSANQRHVERSIPILAELMTASKNAYHELPDDILGEEFYKKGLLMISRTAKSGEEEIEMAHQAAEAGMESRVLSPTEATQLDSGIGPEIFGAVYYPGDNHLNPSSMMKALRASLESTGVEFYLNKKITGISRETIQCADGEQIHFGKLIIAAGAWSNDLLKLIGSHVPMQPGKGYSLIMEVDKPPSVPALLIDDRISVTPLTGKKVRIATGMEFGDFSFSVDPPRLNELFSKINFYYPGIRYVETREFWAGHRPCSHDGLPFIGPVPGKNNVFLATGHSMLGITLGPVTGKIISELICELPPTIDIHPFRINR